jgi:hypothetical protein
MPLSVDAGPEADVQALLAGKSSGAVAFQIVPWLARISPVRTALDATAGPTSMVLTLTGQGFTATPQSVRFDGAAGALNATSFAGTPADAALSVNIPTTLANGSYNVRVVLNDSATSVSNPRTLTVIPLLLSPIGLAAVTVNGNQVHQLTLNGARLNGNDVRVGIDGVAHAAGSNANAAQVVLTLGRLLASGSHNVGLSVDGNTSHTQVLQVP